MELRALARPGWIAAAFGRARGPVIASAATYATFAVIGIASVSAGWTFALSQRDAIAGGAQASAIATADRHGDPLRAAMLDFGSNVVLGALPTSIAGLCVIGPFPIAAYRGWVGGIVSVDAAHASRLATPRSAVYYLVTLLLQLAGFTLTMAAGVHVGLAAWRHRADPAIAPRLGRRSPRWAWSDAAALYAVALPAFLLGSLWEFLS